MTVDSQELSERQRRLRPPARTPPPRPFDIGSRGRSSNRLGIVRDVGDGTLLAVEMQRVMMGKTPGAYQIVGNTEWLAVWPGTDSSWYEAFVYLGNTIKPGVIVLPITLRDGVWIVELPFVVKARRMPVGVRITDCQPVEQLPGG